MTKTLLRLMQFTVVSTTLVGALLASSIGIAGAASVPTAVTGPPSAVALTTATVSGNVNPNGTATDWHFDYGTSTSYGSVTSSHSAGSGSATVPVTLPLTGLTPGVTYHFRLIATNSSGSAVGSDQAFHTPSEGPALTTKAATSVESTTATLSGTVNPNGLSTTWYFKYGPTTSYGLTTPVKSAGSGTGVVAESEAIKGLATHTTYHYALVATNAAGTVQDADHAFTTSGAPIVATGAPTSLSTTSVIVNGTVNPGGHTTSYYFQYGTTASYGAKTPTHSAGAGTATLAESHSITGLTPNTTYHYRVLAHNGVGTTVGADATFTTSGPTLTSQPQIVIYGHTIRLSGTVPNGAANQSVAIYSGVNTTASFAQIATVLTGAGGSWTYTTKPKAWTTYKAVWDGEFSPMFTINVETSVSLRQVGSVFVVHAGGAHSFKGKTIYLQALEHRVWRNVGTHKLNRGSSTAFHPTLPKGAVKVRAYFPAFQAGTGYSAGFSAVHVRR